MQLDLELYRREVRVSSQPLVRLSAIDISPDHPQRTLVFVHGFGGQASQWRYQLQHFAFANRVIALDLRGHGRSDQPRGDYSMRQIVDDVLAALDVLGVVGPVALVGHSFGGAVVTELAHACPERVERLILLATAGEYRLNPLYRLALRLPLPVLQALAPLVGKKLGAPPHVLQPWYANNLSKWNGWLLFRSLSTPTLVIRGHLDIVLQKPFFEQVTQAIPGAEEVDMGASGHLVMLERRAAVNRAIERFLQARSRSWREAADAAETTSRAALLRQRPWLAHYQTGVPYTVAVPPIPLPGLLQAAVRRFPFHTALIFEGARWSYWRLSQESNRFAHALHALGLQRGDRVMLLLPNLPQLVVAFFGILKAGGVAVFTLPTTGPDELVRQMLDADARLLITLEQFHPLADRMMQEMARAIPLDDRASEAGIPAALQVILTHATEALTPVKRLALGVTRQQGSPSPADDLLPVAIHQFRALTAAHRADAPEVTTSPDDLAVIHYTGGTTDAPKGVMLSHRNLVANALQTRQWMPEAQEGSERFLGVLPFSHSYGLTTALLAPIALGAAVILKPTFEVADVLKTIKHDRPTIFPGVPNMYMAINDFPGVRHYDVRSIKACISGSAPLPVEVQETFEKLTRGRLVEGYGLTEASPVTHANPLDGRRKVGSIGIPLPSTEARVVDLVKGRQEVPVGQIGELAVRGPQVMLGYWQNPAATGRAVTSDGWLLTGDVAQMDAEGYFRIIARKADMWYPAKPGQPAFPRDVEEVLFEVPQVKEAAVVAIAGQPIAFVIAKKERPTAEALIAYCKRRLPPELAPRLVILVDDFPRTFIGKVLRRELARRYTEGRWAKDG
jgi:long-chain acyl-CoA synthetase